MLVYNPDVSYLKPHIFIPGPPNPENLPEDGKLKSEMMSKDNKRYYLDLKENQRGRFLRVSWLIVFLVSTYIRAVYAKNRGADQLRGNCAADERLCFRYIDSTILLHIESEFSNLWPSSVTVQPSLCQT